MQYIYFRGIIEMSDEGVALARGGARPWGYKTAPAILDIIQSEIKSNLESVWPRALVTIDTSFTPFPADISPSSEPSDRG